MLHLPESLRSSTSLPALFLARIKSRTSLCEHCSMDLVAPRSGCSVCMAAYTYWASLYSRRPLLCPAMLAHSASMRDLIHFSTSWG